jgi:ankyrin repeat protein
LLIDEGADVNAQEGEHRTPIIQAALKEHIEIVRLLLRAGADFNT